MIRINLKKNKLLKKLRGEYEYSALLNRKLNIVKLFLIRLRFKRLFRFNKVRLKFLYNHVYTSRTWWFWYHWVEKWKYFFHGHKSVHQKMRHLIYFSKIFKLNYIFAKWCFNSDIFNLFTDSKKIMTAQNQQKLLYLQEYFQFSAKRVFNFFKKTKIFRKNIFKFFSISFFDRPTYFRYRTKFCKYFLKRQKFRLLYGCLKVRKIQKIIRKSLKYKSALEMFMYFLESRLDVMLYRLHLVQSVREAKQLILHGKILVNCKKIYSPNYNLKKTDILTVVPNLLYSCKKKIYSSIIANSFSKLRFPTYIEFALSNLLFKFTKLNKYDVRFFLKRLRITSFISLLNFYNKRLF